MVKYIRQRKIDSFFYQLAYKLFYIQIIYAGSHFRFYAFLSRHVLFFLLTYFLSSVILCILKDNDDLITEIQAECIHTFRLHIIWRVRMLKNI